MGTGRPHVEITAATLAGGAKNQDRYAYGDGWAFVLDGASSFAKTQPEHDGEWYAEHLKQELSAGLSGKPERTTPEIVEGAIRGVAAAHGGDAASCPTSTIALARWIDDTVEIYLLGDSTAVLISENAEEVLSDNRLSDIARPSRAEYRTRLGRGGGFDRYHREILHRLQVQQALNRNQAGGYWIAGSEPEAAHHGAVQARRMDSIRSIVLATDGAANGIRYGTFATWSALAKLDPPAALRAVNETEKSDPSAIRWPRSKPHDDKTVVIINPNRRVTNGEATNMAQ